MADTPVSDRPRDVADFAATIGQEMGRPCDADLPLPQTDRLARALTVKPAEQETADPDLP